MPRPTDHSTLKPPSTSLKGRYILLAVVVHALLIAVLSMNFYWKSETPPPSQAELWVELPEPEPQPTPPVENTVQEPPEPPAPLPPTQQPAQTAQQNTPSDADIALERARRQAEARERQLAEQQRAEQARQEAERQERERLEAEQRAQEEQARQEVEQHRIAEEQRAEQARQEAERQERERQEAEQRAQEKQARQEAERQAAEEKARQEAERRAAAERARREAAERERIRQAQLARIHSDLGGSGNSTSGPTGGTGASEAYTNRLAGIVRRNVVYTGDRNDNSLAIVYVETDSSGNIKTVRITQSSGNSAWDDAVVRALWKTGQLPADTGGRRPSTKFNFHFRSND